MRCTRRSRTHEHGPRWGRADGHAARHERSQGKLGRHLLAEAPQHVLMASADASPKAPSTFIGKSRRCGSRVVPHRGVSGWLSTARTA